MSTIRTTVKYCTTRNRTAEYRSVKYSGDKHRRAYFTIRRTGGWCRWGHNGINPRRKTKPGFSRLVSNWPEAHTDNVRGWEVATDLLLNTLGLSDFSPSPPDHSQPLNPGRCQFVPLANLSLVCLRLARIDSIVTKEAPANGEIWLPLFVSIVLDSTELYLAVLFLVSLKL